MRCDICKRNAATIHLTRIVEGKTLEKMDLCEACSKAKGIDDATGFPWAALGAKTGKYPRASQ